MGSFFTIWTGQVLSLLGSGLVQFALVWWLTEISGSATVLALATMMAVLPQVLISPIAGPLVDRWNRRLVMMVADGLIALAVVVLAVLFALDRAQVWHIYLLMFVRAAGGAFHWPAMQASTSLMVPEKHLARVAGLNQALQGLSLIVAPPLGALLLGLLPMQNVLAIDVATAMVAVVSLSFVRVPQPERATRSGQGPSTSIVGELGAGLRFLWGWPGMLMVIGIAMLVNLVGVPAMALQPLLVTDHFGGGALEVAWLQSAFGIGFVSGGILLGAWGGFRRRTVTGLVALALNGLGFAAVGLAPASLFPLAVGAMFLAGCMNSVVNGAMAAVLQAVVPPDVQGRVFTLLLSGVGLMLPLGLAVAGPLSDALGVQFWFLAAGAVMATMAAGAFFVPAILRIEDKADEVRKAEGPGRASGAGDVPAIPAPAQ
jgi:DHA3 family macrolide efflux protein-like MFS transporter